MILEDFWNWDHVVWSSDEKDMHFQRFNIEYVCELNA
jgi:hypothetical protein